MQLMQTLAKKEEGCLGLNWFFFLGFESGANYPRSGTSCLRRRRRVGSEWVISPTFSSTAPRILGLRLPLLKPWPRKSPFSWWLQDTTAPPAPPLSVKYKYKYKYRWLHSAQPSSAHTILHNMLYNALCTNYKEQSVKLCFVLQSGLSVFLSF